MKIYESQLKVMKTIENQRKSMKLDDIGLARPGSIMLHFGFSRRFMGADLARPGSIMVHFGISRCVKKIRLA